MSTQHQPALTGKPQANIRIRPKEIEHEIDTNGYFVRQKNRFTTPFGNGEGELPVEAGRYRLIWAKGCHWSNRASIVRELLGLEEAISINLVGHGKHEQNLGWEFVFNENGIDPVLGVQFLSELYANSDPDYKGRATVPAVVDITTGKVVNNDYVWLTNRSVSQAGGAGLISRSLKGRNRQVQ